jgi:hypothetical protein
LIYTEITDDQQCPEQKVDRDYQVPSKSIQLMPGSKDGQTPRQEIMIYKEKILTFR